MRVWVGVSVNVSNLGLNLGSVFGEMAGKGFGVRFGSGVAVRVVA